MGDDEGESEGWSYIFLHTWTPRLPSRQIVGNSRQHSLSPLIWRVVNNRRRPRGSLIKTFHSIKLSLRKENHKNCPFSRTGVLYLSPLSRRLSRAKSRRTLTRASVWQSVGVALSVLLPRHRRRCLFLWGSSLGRRPLRLSWGCGTHQHAGRTF